MNLLDENIPLDQRDILRAWRIRCRVIGQDIARLSIADDNIVVLLHRLKQPTFFTRDKDFFRRELCHPSYGLVWLDAEPEEAASSFAGCSGTRALTTRPAEWGWWLARITMVSNSGSGTAPRSNERLGATARDRTVPSSPRAPDARAESRSSRFPHRRGS